MRSLQVHGRPLDKDLTHYSCLPWALLKRKFIQGLLVKIRHIGHAFWSNHTDAQLQKQANEPTFWPFDRTSSSDYPATRCNTSKKGQELGKRSNEPASKVFNHTHKSSIGQLMHAHLDEFDEIAVVYNSRNETSQGSTLTSPSTDLTFFIDNMLCCWLWLQQRHKKMACKRILAGRPQTLVNVRNENINTSSIRQKSFYQRYSPIPGRGLPWRKQ